MISTSGSANRPPGGSKESWFVSYAWGDDSEEGRRLDQVVGDICARAEQHGLHILRDRDEIKAGDSVSGFMRRIGEGDRIFVVLSAKYLRSPWCMFELFEVWQNSGRRKREFLAKVRVFVLPDAQFDTVARRIEWARFWKEQHSEIDATIRAHGHELVGDEDFREFRRIRDFYLNVGDILATIADIVQPRTLEEFEKYGFEGAAGDPQPGPTAGRPVGPVVSPHGTGGGSPPDEQEGGGPSPDEQEASPGTAKPQPAPRHDHETDQGRGGGDRRDDGPVERDVEAGAGGKKTRRREVVVALGVLGSGVGAAIAIIAGRGKSADPTPALPAEPKPARPADPPWTPSAVTRGLAVSWRDAEGEDKYGKWASFSVPAADGTPVSQRLRWCPPGWFPMGSTDEEGRWDDEGPRHKVAFAHGFWIFETACRQELWQAVMGGNPSNMQGPALPVTNVSWREARAFVERLNARKPGLAVELPSEAQWEYACRAGTTTAYSFGPTITRQQVNFDSKGTVPVGSLPANGWGLHEMHGNVSEWCTDTWHPNYDGAPADGSAWVTASVAYRVVRGGSWSSDARSVRAAARPRNDPADRSDLVGFRCARAPGASDE